MLIVLPMIAWGLHIYFIRIFCLRLISKVFAFLSSLIDMVAPDSAGRTDIVEQADEMLKVVWVDVLEKAGSFDAQEKVEHTEVDSASW